MAIDQIELGRRIRQARESCGMTQDEVAEKLGVSRPVVVLIEQGKRPVSGLELQTLAYLFARDMRDLLADEFAEDDVVHALFRSHEDVGEDRVKRALRDCIALGHELTNLEDLLGISRSTVTVATYAHSFPRSRWEAIQIGEHVAVEERRRLGLGSAPLGDVSSLLEAQGIRTGTVSMPDSVSGLTISHPKVGPFAVVNESHSRERRRFSWCHEYAHVLLDKDAIGMVSRVSERDNLREVRANSFAASFLLPEQGVRQFVAALGKGSASRIHADIFDEAGVVAIDSRTDPATQEIQLYDVVQLAHSYGVSVPSTLYRLRNLKLVSEPEFEKLRSMDEEGRSRRIAVAFGVEADQALVEQRGEFQTRFLALGLEALRREKISQAKFMQLAERVGVSQWTAQDLLVNAGIDDAEPQSVLLPE
ncbi:MAG TPA: XRE family transcriptional regulator [Candidatus Acidoferrales bacterium]|nr:XRE family transcriptional regulator [Candidatus Acidoferrales bacterium]